MTMVSASLGQTLLWCAIQLAVVTTIAVVLARAVGRRNPAAGVWCLRAGLVGVISVTVLAAAPLPSWFGARDARTTPEADAGRPTTAPAVDTTELQGPPVGDSVAATQFRSLWEGLDQILTRAATMPTPGEDSGQITPSPEPDSLLPTFLWAAAGLASLGGLWFVTGLIAVRRLLGGGEEVADTRVTEALDVVLAQLSCTRRVRLIETERVATAATVGFLRPVILLPSSWYDWGDEQLHAVLAHEAAHVQANDFAATVLSQLVVAIHFFHPFAHFLSRQLRLTQELAADATASAIATGRTEYASVLAGMALQTNSQPNLWATQAFLPAPRTMLRRIEMLRDSKELRTRVGRSGRVAMTLVIALATCATVGLRADPGSMAGEEPTVATTPIAPTPLVQRDPQPLSLDWVPNGSLAVIAVKPNDLLNHAAINPVRDAMSTWMTKAGVKPDQLDSITVCWTHPEISRTRSRRLPVMALGTFAVFRSRSKTDWSDFREKLDIREKTTVNDVTVYVNSGRMACFMPDEYTMVTGQTEAVVEVVRTGKDGTTNRFWLTQWNLVKDQPAAVLVDLGAIRDAGAGIRTGGGPGIGGGYPGGGLSGAGGGGLGYPAGAPGGGLTGVPGGSGLGGAGEGGDEGGGMGPAGAPGYGWSSFGSSDSVRRLLREATPIFMNAELLTAVVTDETNGLRVSAVLTTIDEDDSKAVLEGAKGSLVETYRLFRRQQHAIARSRRREVSLMADLMNIGVTALKSVAPARTKDGVGVSFEIPTDQLGQTLKRLAPAIKAVSQEAGTAQTHAKNANNLKQIMLAMHNYHDQHGHFPPSVVLGKPSEGPPVSWRVLLTPYLGREDIYKNYRFNEPWDSDHNAKATADMPQEFRHPLSISSTSTCYFGVVSSDANQPTLFGPSIIRIRDITDGTSNTLAIVEAKRDTHWAKPDDLKFTPGGKLPQFGGFTPGSFSAARADGSVSVYRREDLNVIRPMLTIRDGQVVRDPTRDRTARDR